MANDLWWMAAAIMLMIAVFILLLAVSGRYIDLTKPLLVFGFSALNRKK